MIKMLAESRCPITVYEEYKMMTKKQIIAELKMYGVDATLRARKSTLHGLLMKHKEDGPPPIQVTTEEWMEFTKVEKDHSNSIWVGLALFLLGALVVYAWEDGVSFKEMVGVTWIFLTLFGIPAYVYSITRS